MERIGGVQGFNERLLHDVFGVMMIMDHPAREAVGRGEVRPDDEASNLFFTALRTFYVLHTPYYDQDTGTAEFIPCRGIDCGALVLWQQRR